MAGLRFCAYQYQHLPLDALRGRWRDAERSGFDVLWNCDTVVEPDRPRHIMFDGPATLTMMAAETGRIRIWTLVTSLYFWQPVTFAKAAVTVDHLSGGRVELALGVGDPSAGAKASGVDWPTGERVARFGEFVDLVDLLLRQEVTTYHGQFYRCEEAETVPLPVQQPRPPMTIAAHGPRMLRIAAGICPVSARTVQGMARNPGQACCLALGFWAECFRRLDVKGGRRPFPEETRSALDIEGKHVTIQGPSPDLTRPQLCTFRLCGLGAEPPDPWE